MPGIINEYRAKLIKQILFSTSQDEIQTFIYAAVKGLKEHKVHAYVIRRFLDKTAGELNELIPDDYNSQQLANAKICKNVLNKFKASISRV